MASDDYKVFKKNWFSPCDPHLFAVICQDDWKKISGNEPYWCQWIETKLSLLTLKKMFKDQQSRNTLYNQPFSKELGMVSHLQCDLDNFWVNKCLRYSPFNKRWCHKRALVTYTSNVGYFMVVIWNDCTKILTKFVLLMDSLLNLFQYENWKGLYALNTLCDSEWEWFQLILRCEVMITVPATTLTCIAGNTACAKVFAWQQSHEFVI